MDNKKRNKNITKESLILYISLESYSVEYQLLRDK